MGAPTAETRAHDARSTYDRAADDALARVPVPAPTRETLRKCLRRRAIHQKLAADAASAGDYALMRLHQRGYEGAGEHARKIAPPETHEKLGLAPSA